MIKKRIGLVSVALLLAFSGSLAAGGLDDAKKEFKDALGIADFGAAGRSFMTAAKDNNGKAADWIIQNGARKAKFELYDGARKALVTMKSEDAIAAMCKKGKRGKFDEKMLIAEVLRVFDDKASAEALTEMVLDKAPEVAREAAISICEREITEAGDNLIKAMEKHEKVKGRTYNEIRKALVTIAAGGADLTSAADWKNYWETIKKSREEESESGNDTPSDSTERAGPVGRPPEVPDDGTPPAGLGGGPKTVSENPKFFGQEVTSKRVLFILDGSGSMRISTSNPQFTQINPQIPLAPDARIVHVKKELISCIKALKATAKFDLIVFSKEVKVWSGKLVSAKESVKKKAIEYINEWNAAGSTHTDEAIERGFAYKDVDTIFLLSDGAPTHARGEDTPQLIKKILTFVRDNNASKKRKIFTFGFVNFTSEEGSPEQLKDFMKTLAEENGGKFKPLP